MDSVAVKAQFPKHLLPLLTAAKHLKPQMLLMAFAQGIAANVLHVAFLLPREYIDEVGHLWKCRHRREASGADVHMNIDRQRVGVHNLRPCKTTDGVLCKYKALMWT